MEHDLIIQGLDILDVIGFISRKNRRFQAVTLQEIENILPKNSKEFKVIRKIVLDNYNDYTRSILRIIFGDIEHLETYGKST